MKTQTFGFIAFCLLGVASALAHDIKGERFYYDPVERLVLGELEDDPERYEPSLARVGKEVWLASLVFTPGEGDRIALRKLGAGDQQLLVAEPGQYRRPTPTADHEGRLWLSYEAFKDDRWGIWLQPTDGGDEAQAIGEGINHVAAALPDGGLAIAWQQDRGGQFDVVLRRGEETSVLSAENPLGDWHPSLAVDPKSGGVAVVWDAYDGLSFSVRARLPGGETFAVWGTAAFEGRAQAVYDRDGQLFVAWEEGAPNWGKEYRRFLANPPNFNDQHGGLHRYRLLRMAEVGPGGKVMPVPVPMPSLTAAAEREGARPGTDRIGLYYERSKLVVDDANRVWMLYRHYYFPEVALDDRPTSHIEEGWRLYARCLSDGKWSDAIGLEPTQRDGLQRLSVVADGEGLVAAWTAGRTHRGAASAQRGVAVAKFGLPAAAEFHEFPRDPWRMVPPSGGPGEREPDMAAETVGGVKHKVYFGDLHRHTDLSLCRVYFDGSIDDAYRYAIEAGELDFLGITDHARDINNGNVKSQLWWRSIKEVTRHRLTDSFYPMFAFERSHGETDHNVVTLKPDMLRPHDPPLVDFWAEIDLDTFTIPHNPIRGIRAWAFHDDEKRPLIEIYQGCRSNPMTKAAHDGLRRGYHMGFIGSSDHLATRTSYACVWSPEGGEEPIFRSMQARRTYGATAKIRLVFRTGTHWMGERVEVDAMPVFHYEVDGEADLARIEVVRSGEIVETIENADDGGRKMAGSFRGSGELEKGLYFYIHAVQRNGEEAWSSPIWLE